MAESETISVRVSTELAAAIRDAVAAGEYASADDAVGDALAEWSHRHEDHEEELAWARARIRASLADPRPSMAIDEVRLHLAEVMKRSRREDDAAA